jgi:hypothetical protein
VWESDASHVFEKQWTYYPSKEKQKEKKKKRKEKETEVRWKTGAQEK